MASADGRDGSLLLHQDASLFASVLAPQQRVQHQLAAGRYGWLHVARGKVEVDGKKLAAGDAAAFDQPGLIAISADEASEILLFDLS